MLREVYLIMRLFNGIIQQVRIVGYLMPGIVFKIVLVYLVCIAVFTWSTVFANVKNKVFRFQNYTVEDGLGSNSINGIAIDKKGNLWLATNEGAAKFNGRNFKLYYPNRYDSLSINYRITSHVWVTKNNKIYFATEKGVDYFDSEHESFTELYIKDKNESLSRMDYIANIYSYFRKEPCFQKWGNDHFCLDSTENYIVQHNYFGTERLHSRYMQVGNTLSGESFEIRSNNFLEFKTANGVERYSLKDYAQEVGQNCVSMVRIFKEAPGNIYYLGTDCGVVQFNRNTKEFTWLNSVFQDTAHTIKSKVSAIARDTINNGLWVGTNTDGLYFIDLATMQLVALYDRNYQFGTIKQQYIKDVKIFDDVLWVGTKGGGLYKAVLANKNFNRFYMYGYSNTEMEVNCFLERKNGEHWVGVWDHGIYVFKDGVLIKKLNSENSGLKSNQVRRFIELADESVLIFEEGVYKYISSNQSIIEIPEISKNLKYKFFYDGLIDAQGDLWGTTWGQGVVKYNFKTQKSVVYLKQKDINVFVRNNAATDDSQIRYVLSDNVAWSVFEDSEGIIWVGTKFGLNRFDKNSDTFIQYYNDKDDSTSLCGNDVSAITEDGNGHIWISTFGDGVCSYNKQTDTFTQYNVKHGISANLVFGSIIDNSNNVWIGTSNGITKLNPKNGSTRNYSRSDGLPWISVAFGAYNKNNRTGTIFFGGVDGYVLFNPDLIEDDVDEATVEITNIFINNNSLKEELEITTSPDFIDTLYLDYWQNSIKFTFITVDLVEPRGKKYRYTLKGFDSRWITVDEEHANATYSNLNGGTYTFQVQSTNHDDLWSSNNKEITLIVAEKPWKTWWAIVGYSVILLCIILLVFRYQKRTIIRREESKRFERLMTIFDNINQGIIVIGTNGLFKPVYSNKMIEYFGQSALDSGNVFTLLNLNDEQASLFQDWLDLIITRTKMRWKRIVKLCPLSELTVKNPENGARVYLKLDFEKIKSHNTTKPLIMLIVTDITHQKEMELSLQKDREEKNEHYKNLVALLSNDLSTVKEFIEEVKGGFESFKNLHKESTEQEVAQCFRLAHYLKGNAGIFEFDNLANAYHELEAILEDEKFPWLQEEYSEALARKTKIAERIDTDLAQIFSADKNIKLLHLTNKVTGVHKRVYEYCEKESDETLHSLIDECKRIQHLPVHYLSNKYKVLVSRLTHRFNLTVEFVLNTTLQEIEAPLFEQFDEVFVHLFRNAFDHGLCQSEKETKVITFGIEREDGALVFTVGDNGNGINLEKIHQKLLQSFTQEEVDSLSEQSLINFIFNDSFSTSEETSLISGRGVGLSAVKSRVDELNSSLVVRSSNEGTEFRISVEC